MTNISGKCLTEAGSDLRHKTLWPLAGLLVAATLLLVSPVHAADAAQRAQDIVARDSSDMADGALRCLSRLRYDNIEVLNDEYVLFRGRGDRLYVNKLRSVCVGLRSRHALEIDLRQNRICNLDAFHGLNPSAIGSVGSGLRSGFLVAGSFAGSSMFHARETGTCTFGYFEPVSSAEVDALRAELRSR